MLLLIWEIKTFRRIFSFLENEATLICWFVAAELKKELKTEPAVGKASWFVWNVYFSDTQEKLWAPLNHHLLFNPD